VFSVPAKEVNRVWHGWLAQPWTRLVARTRLGKPAVPHALNRYGQDCPPRYPKGLRDLRFFGGFDFPAGMGPV